MYQGGSLDENDTKHSFSGGSQFAQKSLELAMVKQCQHTHSDNSEYGDFPTTTQFTQGIYNASICGKHELSERRARNKLNADPAQPAAGRRT